MKASDFSVGDMVKRTIGNTVIIGKVTEVDLERNWVYITVSEVSGNTSYEVGEEACFFANKLEKV